MVRGRLIQLNTNVLGVDPGSGEEVGREGIQLDRKRQKGMLKQNAQEGVKRRETERERERERERRGSQTERHKRGRK